MRQVDCNQCWAVAKPGNSEWGKNWEVNLPTQNSNEPTNYVKIQIKFPTVRSSEIPTSL